MWFDAFVQAMGQCGSGKTKFLCGWSHVDLPLWGDVRVFFDSSLAARPKRVSPHAGRPVPPGCRASRQKRSGPPQTGGKPGATGAKKEGTACRRRCKANGKSTGLKTRHYNDNGKGRDLSCRDAGLPDKTGRDPHKPGESPALQSQRRPLQKAAATWAEEEAQHSLAYARDKAVPLQRQQRKRPRRSTAYMRQNRHGEMNSPLQEQRQGTGLKTRHYPGQERRGEMNSPLQESKHVRVGIRWLWRFLRS